MKLSYFADVLTKHPLLGWIVAALLLIIAILKHLSDTVSYFQVIKAQIWKPLAGKLKYKKLAKMAIKSDVEGRINKVVGRIQSELPKGWVEPISIQWVQEESKATFIKDDRVVMKIEPLDKEEKNFAHALYIYLKKAFFPKTQSILEDTHYEATMLQFCRRVINESKPKAYEVFEKEIMEPAVAKKQKILEYLERLEAIDKRGLLTGIFIREIHKIAQKVQFSSKRKDIGTEFSEVLKHLEDFLEQFDSDEHVVSDSSWVRKGAINSYGLLLVAHPIKAADGTTKAYINRAKERANKNIHHLYVFGTQEEAAFVKKVIKGIQEVVEEYELQEEFTLHRDYRGDKGGHGALFALKAN